MTDKPERRPDVLDNVLCIKGTRIPVSAIQEFAEDGYSVDAIIAQYPGLTRDQIEVAIACTPAPTGRPIAAVGRGGMKLSMRARCAQDK